MSPEAETHIARYSLSPYWPAPLGELIAMIHLMRARELARAEAAERVRARIAAFPKYKSVAIDVADLEALVKT